ncbi:hypothetical protein HOY82DRAFT_560722 [Tuber indicum]|nr:hypothetical protein HOY82DRAFT_560722 [Tuber indicum]
MSRTNRWATRRGIIFLRTDSLPCWLCFMVKMSYGVLLAGCSDVDAVVMVLGVLRFVSFTSPWFFAFLPSLRCLQCRV